MKKPLAMFIAGLLAGAVVAGGVGVVSAVTSNDAPIVACADKKTGAMRYSAKGRCKKSERKLSLQAPTSLSATQVAGPKGDTGATGPTGSKGDTGSTGPAGTGLNTVPVSFGSKTLIQTGTAGCCDMGNNNLVLDFQVHNGTSGRFLFGGAAESTYQLWLEYYDASGNLLSCGEGCTYQPGDIAHLVTPYCQSVDPGIAIAYRLHLIDTHRDKPDGAVYFSIFFRVTDNTFGTSTLDASLPLRDFTVTTTGAPLGPDAVAEDRVARMGC